MPPPVITAAALWVGDPAPTELHVILDGEDRWLVVDFAELPDGSGTIPTRLVGLDPDRVQRLPGGAWVVTDRLPKVLRAGPIPPALREDYWLHPETPAESPDE